MKVAQPLWAICLFTATLGAGAAESSPRTGPPVSPTEGRQAEVRQAGDAESQHGAVKAGSNADRLHSLMSTQARGIAKTPARPAAFKHAAAVSNIGAGGPRGANAAALRLPRARSAAAVSPIPKNLPRDSIAGGRASVSTHLGGPLTGRRATGATINGTLLRRKL